MVGSYLLAVEQGYIYLHLRDNNCQEKNIAKGKLRKNLLLILRTFPHESVKKSAIRDKSVPLNHPTVIFHCGDRTTVVKDQNMTSLLYNNLRAEGDSRKNLFRLSGKM